MVFGNKPQIRAAEVVEILVVRFMGICVLCFLEVAKLLNESALAGDCQTHDSADVQTFMGTIFLPRSRRFR